MARCSDSLRRTLGELSQEMECFLDSSRNFETHVTGSFHLVNTSRAGLELLRDAVAKVVGAGLDDRVLAALFPTPTGTTGQNLRAQCRRPLAQQEQDLAEMWLFAVFAQYESWAEGLPNIDRSLANAKRACQFPRPAGPGKPGIVEWLRPLRRSRTLIAVYADTIRADKRWSHGVAGIREMLHLYRYYKEMRNCLIHSDGTASQLLARVTPDAQRAHGVLTHHMAWRGAAVSNVNEGDPITVSMDIVRDVIALLQWLVFNIDSSLLLTEVGERRISSLWRASNGSAPVKVLKSRSTRGWYAPEVSVKLGLPFPRNRKRPDRVWSLEQKAAFLTFALTEGLVVIDPHR